MAKRFTDTNKYRKPFIRSLPSEYKLFWDYLYHDCDHAGVWIVDFEVAQIYLGENAKIDKDTALKHFNAKEEKIIIFDNGNKWFIPSFLEFQYGSELSKTNNVFKSIDKILTKYDLYEYLTIDIVENGTTISSFRNRISKKVRNKIFIDNDLTCQYCGEQKTLGELRIDHFIPLSKDGTNEDHNLICSCVRCNGKKSDLMPDIFLSKKYSFINPSEKIKCLLGAFKKLKPPYNCLYGGKDKDKDKATDKDKDKDNSEKSQKKKL